MDQQIQELHGTIDRLLFQSQDNGFSVFVLQTEKATQVVVRGYVPNIHPGQVLHVQGAWVVHPKFGRQFQAEQCKTGAPTSLLGLKKYLGSGLIKGIGPSYAEKLVSHFGTQVLEIIDQDPARLKEVPGIGSKRIDQIITAWENQKEIAAIMIFLKEKGISTAYALKIYKTYGQNSLSILKENPYRLSQDIWGIGFKIADQIAQNCGIAPDSLVRIKASLLFVIGQQIQNGHLYVEIEELKSQTLSLITLTPDQTMLKIKQSLHDLYNEGKIKLITSSEQHFLTLSSYYFSERGVAQKLRSLLQSTYKNNLPLDAIYETLRVNTTLSDDQQTAIMTSLQQKISIVTGGPGTGKTTIIKELLRILDEHQLIYQLAAPTGRAAKRITQSSGKRASTIHRLLEFDFGAHGFARNENNALKLDFLIIDEASMIDIFLAHAILKALPFTAHIIFIGDINQLPPVGAGNFLHDMIASSIIPCTRLTNIFRQAQDSLIVVNAHRVNNGEFPVSFLPDAKKDFIFIKEDNPENIPHHLKLLFTETLARAQITADQAMVLAPMHRSSAGTQKLNHDLQSILNTQQAGPQIAHGSSLFKINDRVMQLKNNYDKHVFNGDIGTIESIDETEKTVSVAYPEQVIVYEFSELDELVLAYAITIHKSQGSEYKAVIIPLFMQHFTLLQRNLIYTALTRAKKLCIIIGQSKALAMGIKNNKGLARTTFLTEFLTTDLHCR